MRDGLIVFFSVGLFAFVAARDDAGPVYGAEMVALGAAIGCAIFWVYMDARKKRG